MTVELPTLRLLYIDASQETAQKLTVGLAETGLDVTHLESGKGALAFLASQGFDLVLLGVDEFGFLDEPSVRSHDLPVVCLVRPGDCAQALEKMRAGVADYAMVHKAADFPRLLAAILARAVRDARVATENRIARAEAAEARARVDILLNEMKHRIANSLALVVSTAHLQAAAMPQGDARRAVGKLADRVHSIAQVHKGLYTSPEIGTVALEAYLTRLIKELEREHVARKQLQAVSFAGDALAGSVDQAISLGVIVSELIGNAARFAYSGKPKGAVHVRLEELPGGLVELVVEDKGDGLDLDHAKAGLGSQLVEVLTHGLAGQFELTAHDTGARATLRFPITPAETSIC